LFKTLRMRFASRSVRALIAEIEQAFPEPYTPTYVFGNHDRSRLLHRLAGHTRKAKLFATLQLTVRGVPFIYYGEEIGMEHYEIPLVHGLDPVAVRHRHVPQWLARQMSKVGLLLNRDECRSPMQWHGGEHAGFAESHAKPWLSLHPRALEVNVEAQENEPESLLICYRGLLALRRQCRALSEGALELLEPHEVPDGVVAYRRVLARDFRSEQAHVFLNFSSHKVPLTIEALHGTRLFSNLRALTSSCVGEYTLSPYEGIVLFDAPE